MPPSDAPPSDAPPSLGPLPGRLGVLSGLFFGAALVPVFWGLGLPAPLGLGAVAGVLFGGAMAALMSGYLAPRGRARRAAYAAEGLLADGPANAVQGIAVGGWLFLTRHRVVFEPHGLNLGLGQPLSVPLGQVAEVRRYRFGGVNPNGLRVRLHGGAEHRFVGWQAGRWLDAFARAGVPVAR